MLKKVLDQITIVGPIVVAVLAAFGLAHVVPVAENVLNSIQIGLGAVIAIASVWYNKVAD